MDPSQEFEYFPILPDRSNEKDIKNLLHPVWSKSKSKWPLSYIEGFSESISWRRKKMAEFLDAKASNESYVMSNVFINIDINVDQKYIPVFICRHDELKGLKRLMHGVLRSSASLLNIQSLVLAINRATGIPNKYQDPWILGLRHDNPAFIESSRPWVFAPWDKFPDTPILLTCIELQLRPSFRVIHPEPGLIGVVHVFIINTQKKSSRLKKFRGFPSLEEIDLCLKSSVTIQVLKELVASTFYMSPKDIHLSFGGNYLENAETTLEYLGIADGSVIRVSTTRDIDNGPMQTDHNECESGEDDTASSSYTETSSHQSSQTFWTGRSSIWQEFWSARSRATKDGPRSLTATTKFLTAIKERGLAPSSDREIDWSGKGMHVQFETNEDVDLEVGKVVAWSATAVVQKVTCRRIPLARKTIHSRRMRLEDALCEVQHLQSLSHPHIVQLIGTYIQGPDFSILLYPLAEWNLGDFFHTRDLEPDHKRDFLECSMVCLLEAINYIHGKTIRHMDIKPSNILVKRGPIGKVPLAHGLRILLADFDIAHSFRNEDTSKTEDGGRGSPTYCSPEAYAKKPRGRASDIFSLGCVFAEIVAVCFWNSLESFEDCRTSSAGKAYHFNLPEVREWLLRKKDEDTFFHTSGLGTNTYTHGSSDHRAVKCIVEMLASLPTDRPRAFGLLENGMFRPDSGYRCNCIQLPLVREK